MQAQPYHLLNIFFMVFNNTNIMLTRELVWKANNSRLREIILEIE